jgi:hypothetical protein
MECSSGSACSDSVTFSSVTQGDVLSWPAGTIISLYPASRTLHSPYSTLVSSTYTGDGIAVYATTLGTSGSDTITLADKSGESVYLDLTVFELSGVTTSGATSASGTGTCSGCAISTSSSLSFQPGAFLLALMSDGSVAFTGGNGFSFSRPNVAYAYEYAASGISSPTNFPASFTSGFSEAWEELGVQIPALPVVTVTTTVTQSVLGPTTTVTSTSLSTVTATQTVTTTSVPPPSTTTITATLSPVTTTETNTQTVTSTAQPPSLTVLSVDQNGQSIPG